MKITVKDLLNLYKTDINQNNISSALLNKTLFSDEENFYLSEWFENVTLDDIKKPEIEKEVGYTEYTYPVLDGRIVIRLNPSNYRRMEVSIIKPMEDTQDFIWTWDYNGTQLIY